MTVVRVVLAVLLSAAILATALPAADTARSQRAATLAAAETETIATAADRLARRNDAVASGGAGATTLVEVRVPPLATVHLRAGRLAWVVGGRTHTVTTGVRLVGTVRLAAGRYRLRLSLTRRDGEPTVTVRRFKSEAAATTSRVRS